MNARTRNRSDETGQIDLMDSFYRNPIQKILVSGFSDLWPQRIFLCLAHRFVFTSCRLARLFWNIQAVNASSTAIRAANIHIELDDLLPFSHDAFARSGKH